MLAIRRGPASIKAKPYTFVSIFFKTFRPSYLRPANGSTGPLLYRSFKTFPACRQQAAAAVFSEEQSIEDEIKQEVDAPRPRADYQINAEVHQEPVTKFRELAERGLVCQTVVDTLTRDMGLVNMTEVQSLTINQTLKGIDVLAPQIPMTTL